MFNARWGKKIRFDILSFKQQKVSGYNFRQVPVSLICKAFWAKWEPEWCNQPVNTLSGVFGWAAHGFDERKVRVKNEADLAPVRSLKSKREETTHFCFLSGMKSPNLCWGNSPLKRKTIFRIKFKQKWHLKLVLDSCLITLTYIFGGFVFICYTVFFFYSCTFK